MTDGYPSKADDLLFELWGERTAEYTRFSGGGNNRVYKVRSGDRTALLKEYFSHPNDNRDRLRTEFEFLEFAQDVGIHSVPKPYVRDPEAHLGVYEFIDGRNVRRTDVNEATVGQAGRLFAAINQHRTSPQALALPDASEASFSVQEHINKVGEHVERFSALRCADEVDIVAATFIDGHLVPALAEIEAWMGSESRRLHLPLDEALPLGQRYVSPADFGFQNALIRRDGSICFIDFEYAGWDDPARMISDFFWQPAYPVDMIYWDLFAKIAIEDVELRSSSLERAVLLHPLRGIKWCCIFLNEFLPSGQQRRAFIAKDKSLQYKADQLDKARRTLDVARSVYSKTI